MEDWSQAMVKLSCVTDNACGSVHNTLQSVSDRLRAPASKVLLCTSNYLDDITFCYDMASPGMSQLQHWQQHHYNNVHKLMLLLHRIGCVWS